MVLKALLNRHNINWPLRLPLETLQVNMGQLCNMSCSHCHVDAGPSAREVMTEDTANEVIRFLFKHRIRTLDLTGGAPEMSPPFRRLVTSAADLVDEVIVRCNLTVILEENMKDLPQFYSQHAIHLVCSLPCYTEDNVDKQRGRGAFKKSIEALKMLNDEGYGIKENLKLDLVYNPGGAFLPGSQKKLEADYKSTLKEEHGIVFNNLITIANMPINRFGKTLKKENTSNYVTLLADSFNPVAVDKIMCRNLLSVGWDGRLYDCDFNQSLNIPLKGEKGEELSISSLDPRFLTGSEIHCADHCLGCVAGEGSSCSGALT